MPVDKNEWNAGRKWETLEEQILFFLRNNRDKGFTSTDIFHSLGYKVNLENILTFIGSVVSIYSVNEALKTLLKEGTVQAKIVKQQIGEETYYMAR